MYVMGSIGKSQYFVLKIAAKKFLKIEVFQNRPESDKTGSHYNVRVRKLRPPVLFCASYYLSP